MIVRTSLVFFAVLGLAGIGGLAMLDRDARSFADEPQPSLAESRPQTPPTLEELRVRAQLLHETLHATLQIVHHQYYREDEGLAIPAATMKKVFREMEMRHRVKLRWRDRPCTISTDRKKMYRDVSSQHSVPNSNCWPTCVGRLFKI